METFFRVDTYIKKNVNVCFKGHSFSIFSYDLRGRGPEKAKHWSDDHVLGKSRSMFFMAPTPVSYSQESLLSVLKIRGIRDSDRGLYRCRVDFKAAPTRNTRANLTVIGNYFIKSVG